MSFIKIFSNSNTLNNMVNLHFHYREIEDSDFTGILVEIEHAGVVMERFANYDRTETSGEVWGNQRETFQMDCLEKARAFLLSSGSYHPVV